MKGQHIAVAAAVYVTVGVLALGWAAHRGEKGQYHWMGLPIGGACGATVSFVALWPVGVALTLVQKPAAKAA